MLAQFHLLLSALRLKIACFSFFLSFFFPEEREKREREFAAGWPNRLGEFETTTEQPILRFECTAVPRVPPPCNSAISGENVFLFLAEKGKIKADRKNVSWKICSSINGSRDLDFSQEIEFSVNATIRETPRYRSNVSRLTRS